MGSAMPIQETRGRLLLANPRGFCAGVVRAIDAVEQALMRFGAPVYVRRPIVHNRAVIDRLTNCGAIFVRELEEVPEGAVVLLSAHGVSPAIMKEAVARRLRVVDATCPLVSKVHAEVAYHHKKGRHIILIGHKDHPEVIGTAGHIAAGDLSVVSTTHDVAALKLPNGYPIAYAVQTTFSIRDSQAVMAAIEKRFKDVTGPRSGHICYATTNRQAAVESMAARADCLLVVGDTTSSNANRLVEVGQASGCMNVFLIRDARDIDWGMIAVASTVGLTAAASTPDDSIENVCHAFAERGFDIVELEGTLENAAFKAVPMEEF